MCVVECLICLGLRIGFRRMHTKYMLKKKEKQNERRIKSYSRMHKHSEIFPHFLLVCRSCMWLIGAFVAHVLVAKCVLYQMYTKNRRARWTTNTCTTQSAHNIIRPNERKKKVNHRHGKTVNGKYEREAYVTLAFLAFERGTDKAIFDSAFSIHASHCIGEYKCISAAFSLSQEPYTHTHILSHNQIKNKTKTITTLLVPNG